MDSAKSEEQFEQFVLRNRYKLPIIVKATEGVYGSSTEEDISNGDILRLVAVQDKVVAEFDHPVTNERVTVNIPSGYSGGFETVSRHGPDHVYRSVAEVAQDFPPSVRVLEDIKIQRKKVKRGEGLKLVKVQMNKNERYLLCLHYPHDDALLLPFSLVGRFAYRRDDAIYTIDQLKNRMPVWVQREKNIGLAMRGAPHQIPGIPENFYEPMRLSKTTVVKVEHWDDPGLCGIYDLDIKNDRFIPLHLDFTVVPADGIVAEYGPVEDLLDIARDARPGYPVFAACSSGQKGLDYLDLMPDTILVIHEIEHRQGLLIKGRSSNFLVPKNYKKTSLFKIRAKEYMTPFELWNSKHMGVVKATVTVKSPDNFKEARSIYKHDEVRLASMPAEKEELPKLVGSSSGIGEEEIDIVALVRTLSTANASLGHIYVPSYAKAHFIERTSSIGEHCIADILKYENIPLTVRLTRPSPGTPPADDDFRLMQESPLDIKTECAYSIVYVTFLATSISRGKQTAREIPDFMKIRARRMLKSPRITKDVVNFKKSHASVFMLSSNQYSRLWESVGEMESDYCSIEETVQPPLPPRFSREYDDKSRRPFPKPGQSRDSSFVPATLPKPKPRRRPDAPLSMVTTDEDLRNRHYEINPNPSTKRNISPIQETPKLQRPPRDDSGGYLEPAESPHEPIPAIPPPDDGNISEFEVLQLAGLFRHLGFGNQAIMTCLNKKLDGFKLCAIARSKTEKELKQELSLENENQLFTIKHFVSRSAIAETVPKVKPPADGKIGHFSVREMAGLLRYLDFEDRTVSNCLVKQIDGKTVCDMSTRMDDEDLRRELLIDPENVRFFGLKHFITVSTAQSVIE